MTPPAASATARTLPRTVAPRAPRRVSGPAARPRRGEDAKPRSGARRAPVRDPFIVRAIERTARMADSRFLDRLIRGRLWIPLVAAGLMGIVFMQVSMLKLNAGIGRAVQSASTLERQNATMRAQVSGMEAGSKIDETAKAAGMVAPAATTTPSYVKVGGAGQATDAAHRMTAADPDAILRAKQATTVAAAPATTGALGTAAASTTAGAGAVATTATTTTTGTAAPAATTGTATTAASPPATTTGAATGTTGAATATGTAPPAAATGTTTSAGAAPATTGAAPATTGATTTGTTTTGAATATQQPSTSGGVVAPPAG